MKRNGIVLKLGLVIMALFLSILIPFAFLIDRIFLNVYSIYLNDNVKSIAQSLEVEWVERDQSPEEIYQHLDLFFEHEVLFLNSNGHITHGNIMEFNEGSHLPMDWVSRLQNGETIEGERFNADSQENFYYFVEPIFDNGAFEGGVMIFSSIDELHNKMHNVRDWMIWAIVATILIAIGYTFFIVWYLSRPLVKMEKATREIAKGNLNTHVEVNSRDELGSLGSAINDLSVELNNYRKTRSEFLANISHELRTPTSYLSGYAKLIKEGKYETPQELGRYASIIDGEASRLAKLIQELFDLSKMEEGEYALQVQEVDIEDFVQTLQAKVNLKATEKGLVVNVEFDGNDKAVLTDGMKLEQILLNLLENAINYTEQGSVGLYVRMKEQNIEFIIEDTGAGIPENDQSLIFDRFYRLDKSRSRATGGTGLGLAIAAELAKQISGTIQMESEEHKGTRFIVTLPYSIEKTDAYS
ncbi:HAMP domain-containing sensor histidine kinase [Planococcus sp. ISL-109]|uniref:sensor histidine kinase n=1 Tax=Planococcus sp. ISL-109 TaxID=2819166 RepID=UPI001BE859C1|nr:HAMP domain-containing sensor histidine kinase [Planococcus sp. ISL-109]MBT2583199.1 HAMP domain-containing histidine kinase [Planococcus sp. ISL-109]